MVSLIVVDYKTIPKTLEYICNFFTSFNDVQKINIIIIDNYENSAIGLSILEEKAQIEQKIIISNIKEQIHKATFMGRPLLYVCAKKNIGYARGNNLGAKVSFHYFQDKYYLFSNNDLRFERHYLLEQLIQPFKEDESIAVVGPCIVDLAKKQQSPRKKISAWKQLFLSYYDMLLPKGLKITNYITDMDYDATSKSCYWVSGSFMLVDAEKFHEVNGFDEGTFLFYEEAILSERLRLKGFGMYFQQQLEVIHEHGQTTNRLFSAVQRIHYSFDSAIYYFCQYRQLNIVICVLAKINYFIFNILFSIKKMIGSILFRNRKY